MGDDRDGSQLLLMDQLGEIVDVVRHHICAAGCPRAVAMSAQVRRDHVVACGQTPGDPVPTAAMIHASVQ
jgi:hypothetical protein